MATLLAVRGLAETTPEFKRELVAMAARLRLNADYLAAVMSFESAGTFSPAIPNAAGSGAIGLIQFMPDTATRLGTSSAALAEMSATEQLRFVELYYKPAAGALKTIGDHYLGVFWPAGIGKRSDEGIIFADGSHNVDTAKGRDQYAKNAALDRNRDGVITVDDATHHVAQIVKRAEAIPRLEVPDDVPTEAAGGIAGIVALLLFILGIRKFKTHGRLKT